MKYFCKGAICGLIAGSVISSIVVAKNKNLSNMIKEKTEIISKKMAKLTSKIKEGLSKDEKTDEKCTEKCVDNSNVSSMISNRQNFGQDCGCGSINNCNNGDYYSGCNC